MLLYLSIAATVAAALTFVTLEVARHLQFLKYRDTGFVPGTQAWCLVAAGIAGAFELVAVVALILWLARRPNVGDVRRPARVEDRATNPRPVPGARPGNHPRPPDPPPPTTTTPGRPHTIRARPPKSPAEAGLGETVAGRNRFFKNV